MCRLPCSIALFVRRTHSYVDMTREERAQIRWMNARGFSYSKIADIHDISVSTVRNAVENVIYSRPDNASEDDKYLDAEFLARYLPEVDASTAGGPSHAVSRL